MKVVLLSSLLALASLAAVADGYHILCIFAIPSKSHHHLGKGIVKTLLKAGHEVTWVTPFPSNETAKNLNVIDGSVTLPLLEKMNMANPNVSLVAIREVTLRLSTVIIQIPELREVIVKKKFDAVFTETLFTDLDAGFAAVLKVPWLILSGIVPQPFSISMVDEVTTLPVIPVILLDFPIPMSLLQRIQNAGLYWLMNIDKWWNYQTLIDTYNDLFTPLAKARGVQLTPLQEAITDVSLLFVNSHNSFAPAQALPPNVIEIGGYHIEETTQPLPKDLQELMDSSTEGVVYFSMGSVVKSSAIPDKTRDDLLRVLGELPYTVLWKFELELENLPKNVHIRPWMPQAAILAHKNTKVFITHGGLLSTLETLRHGVPVIAIPVFGDQPANAARAVRAGYALQVKYDFDTMAEELKIALKEALSNDKYYKRAKYLSSLFNNRPVSPSKLIQHYVQLAIETKGAHHLRSKALEYTWYQRWMLDIAAILITILFIVYYLLKKIVLFIYNKIKGEKKLKRN